MTCTAQPLSKEFSLANDAQATNRQNLRELEELRWSEASWYKRIASEAGMNKKRRYPNVGQHLLRESDVSSKIFTSLQIYLSRSQNHSFVSEP